MNGIGFRTAKSAWWLVVIQLLAILIFVGNAAAQVTTARLEGVVKDQTDAVVPGVTMVATNVGTNIATEVITNETGLYVFPRLFPGTYTVTAELQGFKRAINEGVHLEVGDTATLNIKLETGQLTETVTVSAQVLGVDTVSTSVGKVVNAKQIEDLPLVSRNPMDLLYLQPGTNRFAGTGQVDGTRAQAANVVVEGVGATEPMLGSGATSTAAPVPIEAVGEYRVVTSSASAEYGRGSGAQVQLVYRSGTNEFHGTAFDYVRNELLNANSFSLNRLGQPRPPFKRNQFGGSVGGPIKKDKAFFHFTYEGIRQVTYAQPNRLVYTNTLKTGIFRYYTKGANSILLVDPKTGVPKVPDSDIATINLLTVDPTRPGKDSSGLFDKLVGFFPAPNNFDTGDGFNTGGYTYLSKNPYTQNQYVIKGDYVLTSKHRIGATYAYRKYTSYSTLQINGTREINAEPYPTAVVSIDSTFTPKFLNEFRVGGVSRGSNFTNTDSDRFLPTGDVVFFGLGDPANRDHPKDVFLPQIFPTPMISFTNNATWIHNNHSFKVGLEIRVNRSNVQFGGDDYLPIIDTRNASNPANIPALPGLNSADASRAAQLTNDVTGSLGLLDQGFHANAKTAFTPFQTKYRRWRSREYSAFFQDTWKVRPNLTLNLGMRYEVMPPVFEAAGLYSYPVNGVAGLWGVSGGTATQIGLASNGGSDVYSTKWTNFGPNVGFNWDPFNTGKWSISANYRISYDRAWMATSLFQEYNQEGMSTYLTLNGAAGQRLADLPKLFNPTTGYFDPGKPFQAKPFNRTGLVTAYDPSYYIPYTGSWSLRIQREVMRGFVVAVSYVGNKATGLQRALDLNQIEIRKNGFMDGFLAAQRNLAANNDPAKGEATGVFGQIYAVMSTADRNAIRTDLRNGNVATVADTIDRVRYSSQYLEKAGLPITFFRLNPQFANSWFLGNNSYSTWHGMKVELTRRYRSGLQFDANYTFSKGLTDYEGGQSQRDAYRDNANRRLDKTFSGADATHVMNANFIWELPVGTGRHWLNGANPIVNGILGGWQINGIFAFSSGFPNTVSSGRNKLTLGDVSTADCTGCDPYMTSKAIKGDTIRFLTADEIKMFTDPAVGSAGKTAQRYFRSPNRWTSDGSVFKEFRLRFIPGEQGMLQSRFEFINVFNHTNFTGFSSTNITSGSFGVITPPTTGQRIIQVALKLIF